MKKTFGTLPGGRETFLYTIACGGITAQITDFGAALVTLNVPDKNGNIDDVVLGYDDCNGYRITNGAALGATVGRNSNRVGGAKFTMNGKTVNLDANDNGVNNLHSGFDPYKNRLWKVERHDANSIRLSLQSPDGDQGFPGNATIHVTYTIDPDNALRITYDAVCDKDTVFNMTNHTYFNLAGHDHPEKAMGQILSMPARFFTADDAEFWTDGRYKTQAQREIAEGTFHVNSISDAGTPGISDPGFLISRECRKRGIVVECLPGATAFVPALVQSGFPCDRFCSRSPARLSSRNHFP